jgi:hypothetical protein
VALTKMEYLVDAVADGVSWVVVDGGQSSGSETIRVSWGSSVGQSWGASIGVSWGSSVGVSWGGSVNGGGGIAVAGSDWGSEGQNSTLLASSAGLSFSDGGEVNSLGVGDFRGVEDWSRSDNGGSWGNGEGVALGTESQVVSNIVGSDLTAFRVDVSVGSTDVAGSVTGLSSGLSGVSVAVGHLSELILSVVLGLGGSNDGGSWGSIGDGGGGVAGQTWVGAVAEGSVISSEMSSKWVSGGVSEAWLGSSAGDEGSENHEEFHVEF